jgi:hypothetical protein
MSVNSNDPRRDAHQDRENYIKSQNEYYTVKGGTNANAEIVNAVNQYVDEVNQNKGLDSIRIQDDAATTQVGDVGGSTADGNAATIQTAPVTIPTASETNPDIVAKIDPAIVKETPKEVVKRAKDADEWSRYIDSLYSESDREADEKKKKAAKWILAAQMMGDTFSALANSYFTAKGANAMTAPSGTQKAAEAAGKLEMDIRAARKAADKEKMDAMQRKFAMDMQRENSIMQREAHDLNKTKMLNDVDYQRKMLDLTIQKFEREGIASDRAYELSLRELGLKEEQLKLSKEELKARKNGTYYANNGGGQNNRNSTEFTLPNGETLKIKDIDYNKLIQVYKKIPQANRDAIEKKDIRDRYGDSVGEETIFPSQDAMLRLVYDNLDNVDVQNELRKLSGSEVVVNGAGSGDDRTMPGIGKK